MLLEETKNYLDITWADAEEEKKLLSIIDRGKSFIDRYGGGKFNYEEEGLPKALLLNYVMYARSGVLEEFKKNYKDDFISLQIESRLEYAKNKEQAV